MDSESDDDEEFGHPKKRKVMIQKKPIRRQQCNCQRTCWNEGTSSIYIRIATWVLEIKYINV